LFNHIPVDKLMKSKTFKVNSISSFINHALLLLPPRQARWVFAASLCSPENQAEKLFHLFVLKLFIPPSSKGQYLTAKESFEASPPKIATSLVPLQAGKNAFK
jgi:hypothetical protein